MLVSTCKTCGGAVAFIDRRWLHAQPPKDGSHTPNVDWDVVRRDGRKESEFGGSTTDDSNYLEQF